MSTSDMPDTGDVSGSIPGIAVAVNLGIIQRRGVHVCGLQFESDPATCYHYLAEAVVRSFAVDLPPKLLEIADELGKLNRQARTGLVVPNSKGLHKP